VGLSPPSTRTFVSALTTRGSRDIPYHQLQSRLLAGKPVLALISSTFNAGSRAGRALGGSGTGFCGTAVAPGNVNFQRARSNLLDHRAVLINRAAPSTRSLCPHPTAASPNSYWSCDAALAHASARWFNERVTDPAILRLYRERHPRQPLHCYCARTTFGESPPRLKSLNKVCKQNFLARFDRTRYPPLLYRFAYEWFRLAYLRASGPPSTGRRHPGRTDQHPFCLIGWRRPNRAKTAGLRVRNGADRRRRANHFR